jgi:hypothetical protein
VALTNGLGPQADNGGIGIIVPQQHAGEGARKVAAFKQWLIRKLGGTVKTCNHRWRVLIEHYPTYAWDKWECERCKICKDFPHSDPPTPLKTEICNLAHVHIVNNR